MNGDGLVDALNYESGSTSVAYLNTGSGWVRNDTYAAPQPFINSSHQDLGSRMIDVNGDGLTDEVRYV